MPGLTPQERKAYAMELAKSPQFSEIPQLLADIRDELKELNRTVWAIRCRRD